MLLVDSGGGGGGHVVDCGVVVGPPPHTPPSPGPLPRPRALLLPRLSALLRILLRPTRLQGAFAVGVAAHMGAAAGGGVAAVRVAADGNARSADEEWVHPDRLLRRAQPAAARSMRWNCGCTSSERDNGSAKV